MATRKHGAGLFDASKFAQSLRGLVEALPSEAKKQEAVQQLDTLISFLGDLKSRIVSVPTQEDTTAIRKTIDNLTALFDHAKTNSVLGAAIGIKTTASRGRPSPFTPEQVEAARSAVARFDRLPIDEIRKALDAMAPRELQALADAIGLRTSRRSGREALAHQIATKITNTRGYRSLRDGTDQP